MTTLAMPNPQSMCFLRGLAVCALALGVACLLTIYPIV